MSKSSHSIFRSFFVAGKGVFLAVKRERNLKIVVACMALAIIISLALGLSVLEWCIVLLCCALVMTTELINSAIEATVDLACPERNPLAGYSKDTAAAATFIASSFSLVMACFIYGPKIWVLFGL